MIDIILKALINTPFYPHWLDFRNTSKANYVLNKYFKGRVIETGAGNCVNKLRILSQCKKVKEYIATDYTSWDDAFAEQKRQMNRMGKLSQILYGDSKDTSKIDKVCDALNLPFNDSSFDTYCSFEVIEHIPDLNRFFSEAFRVLKKGGYCIVTSPFLFRDHGGIDKDFHRVTMGGYYNIAKENNALVEHIKTESFFGTTLAILVNQFVIRRFLEGNVFDKIIWGIFMVPIYFTFNIFGYFIDKIYPDMRFASRYHVVMKKK